MTPKINKFMESKFPWWLNNLIRLSVSLPVIPFYVAWQVFTAWLRLGQKSEIVDWPTQWDWSMK